MYPDDDQLYPDTIVKSQDNLAVINSLHQKKKYLKTCTALKLSPTGPCLNGRDAAPKRVSLPYGGYR